MKEVFVICNHHGQFLGKQGQWLDESEPAAAWRSPHRDVALNHMVEINAREIDQRLVLLQCPLNEKDIPLLGDAEPARKSAPVTFDEPEVTAVAENDELDSDESEESELKFSESDNHEVESHEVENRGQGRIDGENNAEEESVFIENAQ